MNIDRSSVGDAEFKTRVEVLWIGELGEPQDRPVASMDESPPLGPPPATFEQPARKNRGA